MRIRGAAAIALLLAASLASSLAAQGSGPAAEASLGGRPAELHFRWAAGGRIVGRPLVGDGIVYFLSEDRAIYGIDDSPRVLFRSGGFSPKARYATARGGSMLVSDGDALIRLNRAGHEAWRALLQGSGGEEGLQKPAEGRDGRVFAAGTRLLCRSATGRPIWDRELTTTARVGPLVDPEGDLVLGLADGSVETWSAFGRRLWRLEGQGPIRDMALNRGRILVLCEDGRAQEALGPGAEGAASWAEPLARDCLSVAASAEDAPAAWYLLSTTGRLDALDADGGLSWSLECGKGLERVESQPGRAYLTGRGRVLSVTRLGKALRELKVSNASAEAAVSPTGIVYSGGLDWILYAYRFDTERLGGYGRAKSPSVSGYGLLEGGSGLDEWGGPDRGTLSSLLDDVEKSLKSGNMDDEARALRFCAALALSRAQAPYGSESERRAAPLDLRARASACLGASGSLEARDILLRVLSLDPEPSVRAAVIEALGVLAWDADGASVAAIGRALGSWPDPAKEPMAIAAASALEAIARYEGVPPGPEGMRILISLVEGPWPGRVRTRAEAALESVARSSRPTD